MSTLTLLRSAGARSFVRRYATAATDGSANEWVAKRQATKAHAASTSLMWKRISFYVCIPGAIVMAIYVKKVEDEHQAHLQHEKEHGGHETPEYEYLNKRVKPFPWGMNSLFFNSDANKDMSNAEA